MTLECRNVIHSFRTGNVENNVLAGISLSLNRGDAYALLGPSGSGKSTLLSVLGCLLRPTSGELIVDGQRVDYSRPARLVGLRQRHFGFVFQQPQLLPFLTVEENLRATARNAGMSGAESLRRASELLTRLGVGHLRSRMPGIASGGEQQRVAVARALMHRPPIILADEPTAALDWGSGRTVVELLVQTAKEHSAILVAVTHDPRVAAYFQHQLLMDSGRLVTK